MCKTLELTHKDCIRYRPETGNCIGLPPLPISENLDHIPPLDPDESIGNKYGQCSHFLKKS